MARSGKVRVADHRKNLKKDPVRWKACKEKDKLRKQQCRAAEKEAAKQNGVDRAEIDLRLKAEREKARLRQQKCRLKRKAQKSGTPPPEEQVNKLGSYSSYRQLSRASNKIYEHLPSSPRKKRAVLSRIVKESYGLVLFEKEKKSSPGKRKLDENVSTEMVNFYYRNDISWQAPGKRDTISVKDTTTGKRTLKQKRYLMMSIPEAKNVFDEENGANLIGLSTFYKLRPQEVLPSSKTPHNVCVCVTHANFSFLVDATLPYLVGIESQKALMTEAVCNTSNENCMRNKCEKCNEFNLGSLVNMAVSRTKKVLVKKWIKEDGRLRVDQTSVSLGELIQTFNENFPVFKEHSYVKTRQSEYFELKKKTLKKNEAIIQVDFAENATLLSQDEIQSAHWCHGQATLFTCVIWTSKKSYSYVVVSDDLSHSKQSAWLCLKAIVTHFKQNKKKNLKHIHLFSDNCAGQFRSKFTVCNLCYLDYDLGVKSVTLNTFAAGHGKGAVDAIGGMVKRLVWLAVKARKVIVNSPKEFYEYASKKVKKINVIYVPSTDIESSAAILNKRFKTVQKLKGIQRLHYFKKIDDTTVGAAMTAVSEQNNFIMFGPSKYLSAEEATARTRLHCSDIYSDSSSEEENDTSEAEPIAEENISPGVFVKVQLASQDKRGHSLNFVGICQSDVNVDDQQVRVLFLKKFSQKASNIYCVDDNDEKYIDYNEIVGILRQPQMRTAGNRILYEFHDSAVSNE